MQGGPVLLNPLLPTSLCTVQAASAPQKTLPQGPFAPLSFLQTSTPAGCHGGGPGASLSHLIASLHLHRPPSSSQQTTNISWLQILPAQGVQLFGGHSYCLQSDADPVCKLSSSDPTTAKGTPENPKLTQSHPQVTPQPRCKETPSPPHSTAWAPPTTAALGMMELPKTLL